MREAIKNIFIVVASVVITLLVLECMARFYLFNIATVEDFRRFAALNQLEKSEHSNDFKFSIHRHLGQYPTPNYEEGKNKHNSLGFRGDEFPVTKPDGEYRIVCIGGSTTYTSRVPDYNKAYPALLQKELHKKGYNNVRVINSGVGGWRSFESVINFQLRVLELDPDLIVVYHGVNDIASRMVWPPEFYRGDNSGHLIPKFTKVFMPPFYEYSTLVRIVMIQTGLLEPHAAQTRVFRQTNKQSFYGKDFLQQWRDGKYPDGLFRETPAMKMLEINKPVYFQNNIASIASVARKNGMDVLLSSFAYSKQFPNQPKVASEEYQYAFAEQNVLLEGIAQNQSVYFYDYAANFPDDNKYYRDGVHVNEQGSQLKAELFAGFIADNILAKSLP